MPDPIQRERDLVLFPGEFSYVLNATNGQVNVLVGPFTKTVAGTDFPVLWDARTRQFSKCDLDRAHQVFSSARQGEYIMLQNPAKGGRHPEASNSSPVPELEFGRTVIIPGPSHFALYPGQTASIIPGHILRSNQYLIVRVVDENDARANWNTAIVKAATPSAVPPDAAKPADTDASATLTGEAQKVDSILAPPASDAARLATVVDASTLSIGQLFVIKGTDVSFYIPPTGVEVVADENGKYVRDAVTLERLEHCVLLGENGTKRFVRGPAVVFPSPTETFVLNEGNRKFKAIELNANSGIYVKVIAEYEEDEKTYNVGDELFITGLQQAIYYPRPEHLIIRYGDQQIHYAIAIPTGEGRYVLNRTTGVIQLVTGPRMLLPDPRTQVIIRRVLDERTIRLWYPDNSEAIEVNRALEDDMMAEMAELSVPVAAVATGPRSLVAREYTNALRSFAPDVIQRKPGFTKPRTITLNTKYDGAVSISIWTGYAVLITDKAGNRRVEVGPKNILLAYDESLMAMELSTGKPKNTDNMIRTVYLRVANNRVSDIVDLETADFCPVRIKLSYRCEFTGNPESWFEAENYVKLLCDHGRSILRKEVKRRGIQEFYAKSIDIIRDAILGPCQEAGGVPAKREGMNFSENNLHVYDVEVLAVEIADANIRSLLTNSQLEAVRTNLELDKRQRELQFTTVSEDIARRTLEETELTRARVNDAALAEFGRNEQTAKAAEAAKIAESNLQARLHEAELLRNRLKAEQDLQIAKDNQALQLAVLSAETEAVTKRMGAHTPDLVAAMQALGDKQLLEKAVTSLSPLSIIGGSSVVDVFTKLLAEFPGAGNVVERLKGMSAKTITASSANPAK